MKRLLLLVLLLLSVSPLFADSTLWYNGDFDGANGLANQGSSSSIQAYVYQPFTISGSNWTISQVFSNNLMSYPYPSDVDVEIRSGVSAFNPGTLLYSDYGSTSFGISSTGRGGFNMSEYSVAVDVPGLVLGPGTYWLMVAPSTGGISFVSTTSGAGCIGTPCGTGNNTYFTSAYFGSNFEPATDFLYPANFSMGVIGTSSPVPEPSSLLLLGSGLTAAAGIVRRRFRI